MDIVDFRKQVFQKWLHDEILNYVKEHMSFDGVRETIYGKLFNDDGSGKPQIFKYFSTADDFAATKAFDKSGIVDVSGFDNLVDAIITLYKGAAYDILVEEKKLQEPSTPVQPISLEMISARDAPYVAEIYDRWLKKRVARAANASATA